MQTKEVLLLLTDQWADWEAAYAIPIINSEPQYVVKTIAIDSEAKVSIGGMRAEIDYTIDNYHNFDNLVMLIIPGGYAWKEGRHDEIAIFVKRAIDSKAHVAAICGATIFLGKHGILDNIKHTGDELELFQNEQGYKGQGFYVAAQVSVDNKIITANETAAVEFGRTILEALEIFTPEDASGWYDYFKGGMNKYVIFVSGLLASGKTTLSEHLSKELGVLLINKDYVKEILCDTIGFTNRDENLKLSTATHEIMRHIAKNSMKIGLPIILESNFNPGDARHFEVEVQKYGYKSITIMLTGDKEVLFERFMQRWEDRHWGHKSFKPTLQEFKNLGGGWERFDIGGHKLTVDTTSFDDVNYDKIVAQVRALGV